VRRWHALQCKDSPPADDFCGSGISETLIAKALYSRFPNRTSEAAPLPASRRETT